jgi:hypothetical protein
MYFSGQGRVLVGVRDATTGVPAGFTNLGNCDSLDLELGKNAAGYATGGSQPVTHSVRQSDPPHFTLHLEEAASANLATVLYGQASDVAGGSIVGEQVIAYVGKTIPVANVGLSVLSVKNAAGTTTYTPGVDYIVTPQGLSAGSFDIPATGSPISNGQVLQVAYTFSKSTKIGAFTIAPPFYWLRFEGLNSMDDNKPVVVDLFKTRLYPTEKIPLISNEIVKLEVMGRMFKDSVQPNNLTDGQWMCIRRV